MPAKLWNKDFILLLQANAVSAIGDLMYSVAIGFWVYEKTGSSALMGFIQSASIGGVALSSVIYGVLGDLFPLYLVFAVGNMISAAPMLYMCFHPSAKEFILNN